MGKGGGLYASVSGRGAANRLARSAGPGAAALKKAGVRANFTRRDNYHLTLVFLGETDRAEAAAAALDQVDAPPLPSAPPLPAVFPKRAEISGGWERSLSPA